MIGFKIVERDGEDLIINKGLYLIGEKIEENDEKEIVEDEIGEVLIFKKDWIREENRGLIRIVYMELKIVERFGEKIENKDVE